MNPITVTVLAIILVAIVIWLLAGDKNPTAREIFELGKMKCPGCGTAFGKAAAEKARQDYFALRQQVSEPGAVEVTAKRIWPVTCPACGAKADFDCERMTLNG